ncbi:uncharacterized protein LOC129232051, partial [Uloborus diversus]|uniref:uncharacterized protein LOC129232051 n=1 Tax=Uloborus diversus TaxID=327109 RepID=UPI002409E2E1
MLVYPIFVVIILLQNSLSFPMNDTQTASLSDELVYQKWMNMDKTLKGFVSSGLKKVLPVMYDFSNRVNLSSTCVKQGLRLLGGIKRLDTWALSFIDASGKSIDGLLSSTIASFGDFDQCLNSVAKRKEGNEEVVTFKGKYCVVEFKPPLPEKKDEYFKHGIIGLINATKSASGLIRELASTAHEFYAASLQLGICVPSGCSLEDVNQIVNSVAAEVGMDAHASHCEERTSKPLTVGNIVAISVYSLIGLLVLIGNVLDYYIQKKNIQLE